MIINTIQIKIDPKIAEELFKPNLKQIEDAVKEVTKDNKSIDDKVKKPDFIQKQKKKLNDEVAIRYFQEVKSDIAYDFGYLGNLKKPNFSLYDGLTFKEQNPLKHELQSDEILSYEQVDRIIAREKMDKFMGMSTGFINQTVKERFELLKRTSFYHAMIETLYVLNT